MIKRKAFNSWAAAALFSAVQVHAQQRGKVHRIGWLMAQSVLHPPYLEALRAGLRERGWIDGDNLTIEIRHAGVEPSRQRDAAAELKALPVALIIAAGTITIRAARDGAPGVPVVMVNAGDPVGAGFVASLAQPGGDLSGTSAAGEEVLAKQLELLAAAVPQRKRISVLMNRDNPVNDFFYDAMAQRARKLELQLERINVASPNDLEAAITRAQGGGLVVLGDPMFGQHRARIIELTLRLRVPAIFGGRTMVVEGGLMSYLSSDLWHYRKAAAFVDRILRGAKPAMLPVEQPTEFEFIVNLGTAKALGLTIPQGVLLRANEVIE